MVKSPDDNVKSAEVTQPTSLVGAVTTVGTASALNLIVGLIRIKLIAITLGPVGVGLYGILTNFGTTASSVFGLGLNFSAVREFASSDDKAIHDEVSWALVVGNCLLGLLACPVIWVLREALSISIFGTAENSLEIGVMGIVVMLTLMAGARASVLQGLRHLTAFSWHKVFGLLISTVIGIGAIVFYPNYGIFALVLLTPAANLLIAQIWIQKTIPPAQKPMTTALVTRLKQLIPVGMGYTSGAIVTSLATVVALSLTLRQGGTDGAGQLQAVLTLSYHYIGFLLLTMQADFYPRLTASRDERKQRHDLINQQAMLGLLISGPIFLIVASTSNWLIPLLYSSEFGPASELMRWWILGDLFTIPAWVAGFVLMAQAKARAFFLLQLAANAVFIAALYLGYQSGHDLQIAAVAKIALSVTLFAGGSLLIYLLDGFAWKKSVLVYCLILAGMVIAINVVATGAPATALIVGLIATVMASFYGLHAIFNTMDDDSRIIRAVRRACDRVLHLREAGK